MSAEIEFFVPGTPVGKGRPRATTIGGKARLYTPAKTASYEGLVAHAARVAMAGSRLIAGAASISLDVCLTVPQSWSKRKQADALAGRVLPTGRPDADNYIKAVLDGCNGVTWNDDAQVVRIAAQKRYAGTPGVHVRIIELGEHA